MGQDIRYGPKYRRLFAETLPRFQLLEIEPIFKEIGYSPDTPLRVFDVGANTGTWSLALLQHSAPWIGTIHMFEPMPGNRNKIKELMQDGLFGDHKDQVTINGFALSDKAGKVEINFENDVTGFASIDSKLVHLPMRNQALDRTLTVETQRLDDYCEANGIEEIDILKIDVEGHELAVLKGAERMFAEGRIRVVAYEIGPHQMSRRDFYKDFFEFFEGHGYANYRYREAGWKPALIPAYMSSLEKFDQVCMRMAIAPEDRRISVKDGLTSFVRKATKRT
ncbi:hypothetical protein A8B82_04900 [Sulfitobacter sp. EhC04]|uniref:FkbM family methyltransferase n=1 Tax=Sulfitobacter sp. EhC04 TaxID=1849168 RepID=UPI0007F3A1D6|nr:FkbM family methyltransferase [Sulfitobacter sp. EhC04]OAN69009.1 hypothetical protein A8B82_04900 [Sulfitobacter sp. EhC04]